MKVSLPSLLPDSRTGTETLPQCLAAPAQNTPFALHSIFLYSPSNPGHVLVHPTLLPGKTVTQNLGLPSLLIYAWSWQHPCVC